MMAIAFSGADCIPYMDEAIITGKNENDHLTKIKSIFLFFGGNII